ncbi:PHD-finger domain-containing protein [Cryptosporidium felis]|nr:PHD-finger domain-containing protein [Cryptosporidium felis]
MYCSLDVFRNKYHVRCRFTKLTYCTCTEGSGSFHYSGNRDLNYMFGRVMPSSQIHELFKILAESEVARNSQNPNVIKYKQIEQTVMKEREELMKQYEKERKKRRELASDNRNGVENRDDMANSENAKVETSKQTEQEAETPALPPTVQCCAEECFDDNDSDELVECNECHKTFHPCCCSPSFSMVIGRSFPWNCSSCYNCTICKRNDRVNSQVFCDICSRCFHINCLNPKLPKVPRNLWLCNDCRICSRCHTPIDFPHKDGSIDFESLPEGFDFLDQKHGTRVCFECKDLEKELICNVCNKVLDNTGNRVCSLCRICVHEGCLNGQLCKLCDQ